ncbi:MAG: PQ-loop domain-containing transporter [Minisyncoccia bacterium]
MTIIIEVIGFIGSGLVIWAYMPQIEQLIREHCSVGISRKAYAIWFIAAIFLLAHAALRRFQPCTRPPANLGGV